MPHYPVFLDLSGRACLVVGGGGVAERKIEGLVRAGGRLTVVAPEVTPGIAALVAGGRVVHHARPYRGGDLAGFALAVAATSDESVNRAIAAEADARGVLLNVVDRPELSTFIAPAVLERGELQVAVSTSGAAPALAAAIRDRLAGILGPEYGAVVTIVRRVRERIRAEGRPLAERQRILRRLAAGDLADAVRSGDRAAVERMIGEAIGPDATLAPSQD